ncbi:MAG: hypothetical protein K0R81_3052 [Microbacterium sp.]|nr:hypothetical protein [Microbacterium sp.]
MPPHTSTVTVTLGQPIYAQALFYTAMFSGKPFAEALLVYRRGGTYTILSPGEDHHGCWVSATAPLDPPRRVSFMSLPSADWDDDIAAHTLTFAPDTGAFTQELRLPGESVPRPGGGVGGAARAAPSDVRAAAGAGLPRGSLSAGQRGRLSARTRGAAGRPPPRGAAPRPLSGECRGRRPREREGRARCRRPPARRG